MGDVTSAILTDRAVLSVAGTDAISLLQGLVTVDMDRLADEKLLFGALLAPQGKIQFDFFIHEVADGLLLDMDATRAEAFLKRMKLYKLRADVELADVTQEKAVIVQWSTSGEIDDTPKDPRLSDLGSRTIVEKGSAATAHEEDYHAHRVQLGIPEAGKDFAFDDIFPHDAMMDAIGGVNFDKGCYVGQEVVSRVQHRSTARKRFYIAGGVEGLNEGGNIIVDEKSIGTLGKPYGDKAVALVRVDKISDEDAFAIDGVSITLMPPSYFASQDAS